DPLLDDAGSQVPISRRLEADISGNGCLTTGLERSRQSPAEGSRDPAISGEVDADSELPLEFGVARRIEILPFGVAIARGGSLRIDRGCARVGHDEIDTEFRTGVNRIRRIADRREFGAR